jgi:hypothetical protein
MTFSKPPCDDSRLFSRIDEPSLLRSREILNACQFMARNLKCVLKKKRMPSHNQSVAQISRDMGLGALSLDSLRKLFYLPC